jgi:4-phosphopantoate--beta-alanine ligase
MKIPRSHPRYDSLILREKLVRAWKAGIVVPEGLIAHGRGEAFDYLLGETSSAPALVAENAASAFLLEARRPMISVNGNVAALASREVVRLAKTVSAGIEVNLFHRTETRVRRIAETLREAGATTVLALHPNARIPGLESKRALSHKEGIFGADVVLVPLEDGDRTEALVRMGKAVITIDLNPLSRTSLHATIPIVDELTRALPNLDRFARSLHDDPKEVVRLVRAYDRSENMKALFAFLDWRLTGLHVASKVAGGTRRRSRQIRSSKD